MRFNHYLSIIIINNNSNKLLGLISWLTEKQYITSKIQLIFINYLTKKDKEIWEEITKICQQKQVKLKVINYCQNINIYSALKKAIVGDIIIFTHSDYQPEATWLKKIAEAFSEPQTNLVIGKIIDEDSKNSDNRFNNLGKSEIENYLKMWQKQTANLAIRANFWQKIKHFNLLETDNINNICCCRILRELESEVTYLPDTIVKKI